MSPPVTPQLGTAQGVDRRDVAWSVAAAVADPELPMLTIADLGVLREVTLDGGRVVVTITPTYTGCPAMATIRADLNVALRRAGFADVEIRTSLSPAWTSDWINDRGRRSLHAHGISPPGSRPFPDGIVDLVLLPTPPSLDCPQCSSNNTRELSHFGATACRSLYVCRSCGEPFEHVKEI